MSYNFANIFLYTTIDEKPSDWEYIYYRNAELLVDLKDDRGNIIFESGSKFDYVLICYIFGYLQINTIENQWLLSTLTPRPSTF